MKKCLCHEKVFEPWESVCAVRKCLCREKMFVPWESVCVVRKCLCRKKVFVLWKNEWFVSWKLYFMPWKLICWELWTWKFRREQLILPWQLWATVLLCQLYDVFKMIFSNSSSLLYGSDLQSSMYNSVLSEQTLKNRQILKYNVFY